MAADNGDSKAMNNLGWLYHTESIDYEKAEKYYLMAADNGDSKAMNNLGNLYHKDFKDIDKAEKYYLMAVKNNYKGATNSLAWFYFEQKIKKQEALKCALQSVANDRNIHNTHTLACIYVWHNQYENAINIANEFIYDEKSYEEFEADIILYLMLLLAKKQYKYATEYFEHPDLNLKEKFKPLYYALLHFTDDKNYHKIPPELTEPVNEIIEKVKQMATDYA
ncbi:MAG: sel1 repeat family protein [Desulfobacterales bacterium]|nr:sel1 repeat family protein [Desulfobacterales bacterium]